MRRDTFGHWLITQQKCEVIKSGCRCHILECNGTFKTFYVVGYYGGKLKSPFIFFDYQRAINRMREIEPETSVVK